MDRPTTATSNAALVYANRDRRIILWFFLFS
jgi:hypothetical protein